MVHTKPEMRPKPMTEADRLEAFILALVAQMQLHGIPVPDLDLAAIRHEPDRATLAASAAIVAGITRDRCVPTRITGTVH